MERKACTFQKWAFVWKASRGAGILVNSLANQKHF